MSKFRVKMDMSQFYDDERNLAYILVDPKWKHVICLQEHVQKLFDVPNVQFLTDDGVYIPPLESVDIIKSSDVLKAIIPQQLIKKKKKSKSSLYDGFIEQTPADESMGGEKRKCDDERLTCSTPNTRPNKKQKTNMDGTVVKALALPENQGFKKPKNDFLPQNARQYSMDSDTVTSTNNSTLVQSPSIQEHSMNASDANEETAKCHTRKRIRKKKKKPDETGMEEKTDRLSSVPVPISSSTLRLSKSMSTPNRSPKHVHFGGDSTVVELGCKPKGKCVTFRCHLSMNENLVAREISPENMDEGTSPSKKPLIQIQENIVIVEGNDESTGQEQHNDSSVIEVEDSLIRQQSEEQENEFELTAVETGKMSNGNALVEAPSLDISIDAILPLSEPLEGSPEIGDIVLFKIIGLTDACTPGVSDFICGRCDEVNSTKRTMSCFLLDGFNQLDGTYSSFSAGDVDGVKFNRKTKCCKLHLDGLLEKKVFRMSSVN